MEDATKHLPINGGTLFTDLRQILCLRTKKTRAFAYAFILIFIGFTVFLAFNPSPNPSSPWFSNIFTSGLPTTTIANSNSSSSSSGSLRSQFSSIYSYLFPSNSSQPLNSTASTNKPVNNTTPRSPNTTAIVAPNPNPASSANKTANFSFSPPIGTPSPNSSAPVTGSPPAVRTDQGSSVVKNNSSSPPVRTEGSSVVKNNSSPPPVRTEGSSVVKSNSSTPAPVKNTKQSEGLSVKQNDVENLVKSLVGCNLFDGDWVRDESYPLYKPGSCPLIDYQFNCILNGRPDRGFQKLKWKPYGCSLPRLDGSHMLELLRGKRLVFVGDSLNRNMWESLICILRNSVKDQTKVYEASGRHHFRTEPSYSFVFKDFNCTVEFFVSPFLVREWEVKDKNGKKKETLRLDLIGSSADQYKCADIIVYNTGHWWTHDKTAKGKDYYQEGSNVYSELNVLEAFRKAMTTWGRWVDANINPMRTLVFFRGYSAAHFSGGQWNSGGQCDHEVEPIKNKTYLAPYPAKMMVMEKILRNMKTKVSYLNITRLTDYRKDGHPSIYRKRQKPQNTTEEEEKIIPLHVQDCSHWCLPGVPDAWNEILYAELLVKYYQKP